MAGIEPAKKAAWLKRRIRAVPRLRLRSRTTRTPALVLALNEASRGLFGDNAGQPMSKPHCCRATDSTAFFRESSNAWTGLARHLINC
jgi:hypothetical protein